MKQKIFKYLKSYSSQPFRVDRLVVSAFIEINAIDIKGDAFLEQYLISADKKKEKFHLHEFIAIIKEDFQAFSLEDLIELFEYVISPSDRIINGAVFTPLNIRNHIVDKSLFRIKDFKNFKLCDPACGCSAFLYTAARAIKKKTGKTYQEIFKQNIFGLDIQGYSITRSKILLTLFVLIEGEDTTGLTFNLHHGDALSFNWIDTIHDFSGFHVIVGNPPYVCSRNMDKATLDMLAKWGVTKTGHPDLYIPFFQIGYENLVEGGLLGLITVNTFIKSINGRALRSYFAERKVSIDIINFGGEQIFKDKSTYTCICFLRKREGGISYKRTESSLLETLRPESFYYYSYDELNHHDGWNLVDSVVKDEFIKKVETAGKPFKDLFETRNGIATLKNDVYKFKPISEDEDFYYMAKDDVEYKIEKLVCRRIVNANKIKSERDLKEKEEKIIYPYKHESNRITILPENEFKKLYPHAYNYLKSKKSELDLRDKGKVEKYEKWYAYGRRQSMDTYAYKLFFPHICEKPTFVISKDRDLLFYNGIAVISTTLRELVELRSLLESDIFFDYVKSTAKDYSSGYFSMSRNYIKNFGIPEITKEEKMKLTMDKTDTNSFWKAVYKRKVKQDKKPTS